MSHDYPKVICDRCGTETYKRQFSIETTMELGERIKPGISIDEYSGILSEITKAPKEVALEWSRHGMYELCKEKTANCPQCGNQLKTWKAKIFLSCEENWRL